jgi:hypothetical protein
MDVEEFRDKVKRAFGDDLHRASPATVRDFLDRLQTDTPLHYPDDNGNPSPFPSYRVDESARSYEEVMRSFFVRVLDLPPEQAIQMLWAVSFDLAYAIIESHDADRIGHLFRGLEEPAP